MRAHIVIPSSAPDDFRKRVADALIARLEPKLAEAVAVTFEGISEVVVSKGIALLAFVAVTCDFPEEYDRLRRDYEPLKTLVLIPRLAKISTPMVGRLDNPEVDLRLYNGWIFNGRAMSFIAEAVADLSYQHTAV
jgi:hypothetical protein